MLLTEIIVVTSLVLSMCALLGMLFDLFNSDSTAH